jgi:hypothetical protein
MMQDIHLSEEDGWFFLSYTSVPSLHDGDLGRGGAGCVARFQTSAERSHYIEIDRMREVIGSLNSEIRWLKTVKGANKNLREARAAAKAEKLALAKYRDEAGL